MTLKPFYNTEGWSFQAALQSERVDGRHAGGALLRGDRPLGAFEWLK